MDDNTPTEEQLVKREVDEHLDQLAQLRRIRKRNAKQAKKSPLYDKTFDMKGFMEKLPFIEPPKRKDGTRIFPRATAPRASS